MTCAPVSINNSGSSFTAWWKIGTGVFPIVLLCCANIFVSSSNILLQSGSRTSPSRKQLTYSSYSVLWTSELMLSLPGVAGRSGLRVPFCLGSVGLSGVVQASFPVGAGGIVPASFLVGAHRIIPASVLVGAGGAVSASFSEGVLVASSEPSSARSIKRPQTLLPSFSCSFPLVGDVGGGRIFLLSGDGGGTGISWSAGGSDGEIVHSRSA